MERRKKLGFDTKKGGGLTTDPAADLFGFGAFMAVDQHSGMPMFGNLDHRNYQELEDEKKEERAKVTNQISHQKNFLNQKMEKENFHT